MKKKFSIYLIFIIVIGLKSFAQEKTEFPYKVVLKDVNNNDFLSSQFNNDRKPIIIELFATHCKPCISQLNSFKEVYNDWQKLYGVKIIVISSDVGFKRKAALKMIKKNNWPFEFYFDTEKKLFKRLSISGGIPETIFFDGNLQFIKRYIGIESNVSYKMKNGKINFKEKFKKNDLKGKYKDLEVDLTRYEELLKTLAE